MAAESDRIVTAGGVNAWHDLTVYLNSVTTRPMKSADESMSDFQAWIADNSHQQTG